ncbi:MAG: amidohydrolase [Fimbriimonadaceae bacterium]|nr:amidohydrolase [Alphaproteobacteria bacterium]
MVIKDSIAALHDEMIAWRRDLHANPETAFEEFRTSEFVASKLESFGIEVHKGLAGTGIVGVLKGNRSGGKSIGLRADMDALDITEQTNLPHSSKNPGKMHACGHDGHTTMLLGAAKHLADKPDFSGTVYFIFQPAEENEGGGRVMVEDGLFDKFPMDAVYGLHNWPGMPVGHMGVMAGPVMASFDIFEIVVTGKGSHAAMPHEGIDTIVTASAIVTALQTISSRNTHPADAIVVSVTQIHGGDTWNVIPETVVLRGTSRAFSSDVQDTIEPAIKRIAEGVCATHGATMEMSYTRCYPPTINSPEHAKISIAAASKLVASENIDQNQKPSMGAEDFSFMLKERPGSYIWLGAGEEHVKLHNPAYDFNDDILPLGAAYWTSLVEESLGGAINDASPTTQA